MQKREKKEETKENQTKAKMAKIIFENESSTSGPGGNQVDGLPLASSK